MDYDFSGLCADQIEKVEKRLNALSKAFIKEYNLALNVINHPKANGVRGEITQEVQDELRDTTNKSVIFFTECMNKVVRSLSKNLD